MRGLGTLINTIAVIAGSGLGMLFKKGIRKEMQEILLQGCGLAVIFLGIAGTLEGMLKTEGETITTQGSMLLIFSLVLGGLLGQWLDIEGWLDRVGQRLKKMVHAQEDNRFVEGFVNASLIICVGAMAIVGALQDGISGNYQMLVAKSVLDFVIVMVFGATYGIGVMFSALPIFIYQGSITVLAMLAGTFLGETLIGQLSYIGSALIFCVGVNIVFGKKFRVGNLLPALVIPLFYRGIQLLGSMVG